MRQLIARPAAAAACAWSTAYLLLCATGQRFSTQYLDIAWQLIPTNLLRANPLGSVWYLHIQPPMWNLIIGGVLAWSPAPDAISLQVVEFMFGVVSVALLASLLARLFKRTWVGVVIALFTMLDPQVLSGAFTPTYELPTTCGLIAVVWLVVVRPRSPRFTLITLASVGTAVVLTRTIFHPVWLAVLLIVTWWVLRRTVDRRTVVVTIAIPLVLVGGWMVKNAAMFDRPTLSSWFGMNLQRAVVPVATDEQLAGWAATGGISEITAAFPNGFVSYSGYEPYVGACVPKHSNPAVADTTRGGPDDPPNFNSECFLPLYDLAGKDAWWVITRHPSLYLEGRWWALRAWIAEAPPPLVATSPIYRALPHVYRVLEVQVPGTIPSVRWAGLPYGAFDNPTRYSVVQALTTLLVIGAAGKATWRRLRRRPTSPWALVEVVAGLIVAWNFVVGVLFELGEQFRFRATTDPITISIGIWIAWRMIGELRRRRTLLPESVA